MICPKGYKMVGGICEEKKSTKQRELDTKDLMNGRISKSSPEFEKIALKSRSFHEQTNTNNVDYSESTHMIISPNNQNKLIFKENNIPGNGPLTETREYTNNTTKRGEWIKIIDLRNAIHNYQDDYGFMCTDGSTPNFNVPGECVLDAYECGTCTVGNWQSTLDGLDIEILRGQLGTVPQQHFGNETIEIWQFDAGDPYLDAEGREFFPGTAGTDYAKMYTTRTPEALSSAGAIVYEVEADWQSMWYYIPRPGSGYPVLCDDFQEVVSEIGFTPSTASSHPEKTGLRRNDGNIMHYHFGDIGANSDFAEDWTQDWIDEINESGCYPNLWYWGSVFSGMDFIWWPQQICWFFIYDTTDSPGAVVGNFPCTSTVDLPCWGCNERSEFSTPADPWGDQHQINFGNRDCSQVNDEAASIMPSGNTWNLFDVLGYWWRNNGHSFNADCSWKCKDHNPYPNPSDPLINMLPIIYSSDLNDTFITNWAQCDYNNPETPAGHPYYFSGDEGYICHAWIEGWPVARTSSNCEHVSGWIPLTDWIGDCNCTCSDGWSGVVGGDCYDINHNNESVCQGWCDNHCEDRSLPPVKNLCSITSFAQQDPRDWTNWVNPTDNYLEWNWAGSWEGYIGAPWYGPGAVTLGVSDAIGYSNSPEECCRYMTQNMGATFDLSNITTARSTNLDHTYDCIVMTQIFANWQGLPASWLCDVEINGGYPGDDFSVEGYYCKGYRWDDLLDIDHCDTPEMPNLWMWVGQGGGREVEIPGTWDPVIGGKPGMDIDPAHGGHQRKGGLIKKRFKK